MLCSIQCTIWPLESHQLDQLPEQPLKSVLLVTLILSAVALTAASQSSEMEINIAGTASEQAATVPGYNAGRLEDHYGNPDNFIQYIIRVPPIHA